MAGLVGTILAAAVALFARVVGLDRDRAFYPLVMIVIASYYVLFAVMGGSNADLASEILVFSIFAGIAAIGFRTSLWAVVAALAMHGLFDFLRHLVLAGRGVPEWWPNFCLAYDLSAAACLAALLLIDRPMARAADRNTSRDA